MRPFLSALGFLTLLPVPRSRLGGDEDLRRGLFFFPVVGLLIGGVVGAIGYGLGHVLTALPASVVVIIALVAASRGLHLDGLADTADGFFSSRSRERILEIMRDSRTGPMGVVAIASVLLLKVSLLDAAGGPLEWEAVLLMAMAGRCALLLVLGLLPYARADGGLASVFLGGRSTGGRGRSGSGRGGHRRPALLVAWAAAALLAAGWLARSWTGLAAAGASLAVGLLFGAYSRRKVGGYTGDTLGAGCEIVEVVPVLVLAVWTG